MMDAKLIFLYSTVFKWKFILFLFVAIFILTGALSILFETKILPGWMPQQTEIPLAP